MALPVNQASLDYINQAYKRAAADTRILKRRTDTVITDATSQLDLDPEVVRINAVYVGDEALALVGMGAYMRAATGTQTSTDEQATSYTVIGRTVYFWPEVQPGSTLTMLYSRRPADITSDSQIELVGPASRLVKRLTDAYFLLDDGQPELAQRELADYLTDMERLRRRDRRREGEGGQLLLVGHRRRVL